MVFALPPPEEQTRNGGKDCPLVKAMPEILPLSWQAGCRGPGAGRPAAIKEIPSPAGAASGMVKRCHF